jgi:HAD superfamily hydrolase (TIGR01509 family)
VHAAIFDMDGLLIDSEPLWRRAEKQVFGTVGMTLTEAMCEETMGLRTDAVIQHWQQRFPWSGKRPETVEQELVATVHHHLITTHGEALAGVYETLTLFREARIPLGLASSSASCLIETTVEKLGIRDYFYALCSATDEVHGKPDPAVYLTTAKRLGVPPTECVAFEDSFSGLCSAQAAGMIVVAVPAAAHHDDPRFDCADIKLRSLTEFSLELLPHQSSNPI